MGSLGFIAPLPAGARGVLAFLAVLVLSASVCGQSEGMRARAMIEDGPVVVGSPFSFTIEVTGVEDAERPDLSTIARQFDVRDVGRGQSTSIIGGRVSSTIEFHYQMTVGAPGRYTIPSILIRAGGRTLRTDAVSFEAAMAPKSDDFLVRLSVDKTDPYVGEPVKVSLTLYTASSLSMPRIEESGDFGRFDTTDVPGWTGNLRQAVPFLGGDVQPIIGSGTLEGRGYQTVAVARRLIPRESGHATLGPINVATQFMTPVRRGLFESSQPGKRVSATSNAIDMDVRPLPREGRPASFTGLVGKYEVSTDVDLREVNVGDPITLHVLVTGDPLVEDVRLPELDSIPGFEGRLRVSEGQPERTLANGGAVFTVRVRALTDKVDEIPPIELAYFDPAKGTYGVAKSRAIPIRVRPTKRVTAVDAVGAAPVATGDTVESDRVGVAHNYESIDALRVVPTSVLAEAASPVWVASIAAPPLAYAACAVGLAMRRRGERNGASKRRSRALPEAQAVLRGAESVDGIAAGVGTYFEMVTGRPRASITPRDAEAIVAPVAPDEAVRLRGVLERCDAARFAGASVDDLRALREESQTLLKAIDPALRRRGGGA